MSDEIHFHSDLSVGEIVTGLMRDIESAAQGHHRGFIVNQERQLNDWLHKLTDVMDKVAMMPAARKGE